MSQSPAHSRREVLLTLSAAGAAGLAAGAVPAWAAADVAALPAGAVGDAGTIVVAACRPDGRSVMRAYSWSPTGYVLVEDGKIIDRVGMP